MKPSQHELNKIKSEIKVYLSTDYPSEQERVAASSHIKEQLSSLLWEANKTLATQEFIQLKSEVIELFSETIRCTEDVNRFRSAVRKLLDRGVISEIEISFLMEGKSTECLR
ncbi:MAG: hypothetical protein ACSLFH_08035 [Desulfuromonadales bacterium]